MLGRKRRKSPEWNPTISTAPERYPEIEAGKIRGVCPKRFERIRDALQYNLDSGDDIGGSVAVFIDGEPAVDIWGGYFDDTFERPWDRDTIITTHSITKTMTGMAALVLADSGELDFDAPVAKYWPEFAQNGKSGILVKHILSHTSGLAGWTEDVSWEDVYDLDYSCDLLARQSPWWAPGTASGYHGICIGHLVNGVIKRITGLTLGQYFAEHVAKPLGADYHIGIGPEHDRRIACFVKGARDWLPSGNPIAERVGLNPPLTPFTSHTKAWRRAEVGGANGHGNARSVATIHQALASGGVNGVRLLSDKGRFRAFEQMSDGFDLLLGLPVKFGAAAFALDSPLWPYPREHRIAWWGGQGGSLGFVDLDERMSVSFVMNRWIKGPYESLRQGRILTAVYESLART
ncbi:MAG: beta-lactamase family protein [Hyphomonadaceae bacterium]|nr:beta-lactamase family protein [Hyphomonadaceae bacterium]